MSPRKAIAMVAALVLVLMFLAPTGPAPVEELRGPPEWVEGPPAPVAGAVTVPTRQSTLPWPYFDTATARFGRLAGMLQAGESYTVSGVWDGPPDGSVGGQRHCRLVPARAWYRLTLEGRSFWSCVPDDWVVWDAGRVPATPPWGVRVETAAVGTPASRVSFGAGTELVTLPAPGSPVYQVLEGSERLLATGRWQGWLRLEVHQRVVWAPAPGFWRRTRLGLWPVLFGDRPVRTCLPLVLFPPSRWSVCAVDRDGRFTDVFEREYDLLDPVFGRERDTRAVR